MKIFCFTLLLIIPFVSSSQCNLDFFEDTLYACQNSPATFMAAASSNGSVLQTCDFNSASMPLGWVAAGGASFGQPCLPGIDGTDYYWASTSGVGTPSIETDDYAFGCGGSITFDLVYAIQAGPTPCEGPDGEDEGVSVQYSADGGLTWITFAYFNPTGVIMASMPLTQGNAASGVTPFTSWGTYTLPVPSVGIGNISRFRWVQVNSSGAAFDNWGIDNIEVFGIDCNYSIDWSTGATDTNNITVSSNVDTSFIAYAYDTLGVLQCQDTCNLIMINTGFDNGVQLITNNFVSGLQTFAIMDAYNDGCPMTSGLITVELDTALAFVSSSPMPISNIGNTLIYDFTNQDMNSPHSITHMYLTTSPFAQVGDSVSIDISMADSIGDINLANNVKNYMFPVSASFDPNDKKVYPTGDCIPGYVLNDQLLTYTVRFQNTGTAPATNIRISDVIDPSLDASTLKVVAASHDVYMDWISPSVVDFKFDNIMLPEETSSSTGSVGYVVFEIEQIQGTPHGTAFTNQAEIYFDLNPAIITNEVLNTVSDGTHFAVGDTFEITVPTAYVWNGEALTTGGVYTQSIPRLNDCDSIAILYLIITAEIGLDELGENGLNFYPNPSTGKVRINGFVGEGTVEVYNTSGEIVLSENYVSGKELDLGYLAKGVYVVDCKIEEVHYRGRLILK